MKKILIISDTHRYDDNFFRVMEKEAPVDLLIHCGDIEGSEALYAENAHCPVHMVAGNNDFLSGLNREEEFMIGDYKVFLTHGHYYNISMGSDLLRLEAAERGADIMIYGHTHRPVVDMSKGIIALNPGSLTYPRQEGRRPSYIIMTLAEDGNAEFEIRYLTH
ncbi:MAG: metallophosphoesterase [Lachnospiraceae bacterium]|nr:metallophosphoesterase [Lachnospiraceae bacterium]